MKVAYSYDDSFYFNGVRNCQLDPLESEAAGEEIYLLPRNCTWFEPPDEKEGYKIKFDGTDWEYEEIIPEPEPEPYVPTPYEKTQQEIAELKFKLNETDYKILKCSEASLRGAEMPYDLDVVCQERDEWRKQINELEAKLKELEAEKAESEPTEEG